MPRLLGVLLAALALAACGESSDGDYRADYPAIDRQLAALGQSITASLRGAGATDDAGLAQDFDGYARKLGRLRAQLADLDPPASLEQGHDELLGEIRSVEAALGAVAGATRAGDANAAGEAATTLVRAGVRLEDARRDQAADVRGGR